jgi:phosphoenolpyruvate carboxykinase (GTP)
MASEKTAAAGGPSASCGSTRSPCLPFRRLHMGDYVGHWLETGRREGAVLPRIFYVNWFRKDAEGRFIWPGFGENSRVLEWVFRRCEGAVEAVESPIGLVPAPGALNLDGLDLPKSA